MIESLESEVLEDTLAVNGFLCQEPSSSDHSQAAVVQLLVIQCRGDKGNKRQSGPEEGELPAMPEMGWGSLLEGKHRVEVRLVPRTMYEIVLVCRTR